MQKSYFFLSIDLFISSCCCSCCYFCNHLVIYCGGRRIQSYFSSGQEQDYLLVVNSTTKGLSLESPEKPIIKLQTTCFEKLIFALRRYKGNCGTRNRPEKLQDFCETGPSRSEVRGRPTWGKRLEITSFPGCLLNTFPGEANYIYFWD